jgi:hypothetical protein
MALIKIILLLSIALYLKTLLKTHIDRIITFLHDTFKDIPFYYLIDDFLNKYKDISDAYIILIIIILILLLIL